MSQGTATATCTAAQESSPLEGLWVSAQVEWIEAEVSCQAATQDRQVKEFVRC
jgi:hypothetical protein